jgi:tRNA(Ile)-lysidine synthase
MKYLVAVSGGIDSVVLLDKLASEGKHELVVAHFDHGIRKESFLDAQFVERLSKKYGVPFETRREELGKYASEELARERRYAFLREMAAKHDATIVTAHHMNDIAETIAINLSRGTGWRGLAVLDSDIYRPLLGMTKLEIWEYADKKRLDWREDSTNATDAYLRNRLRPKLSDKDLVLQLAALRARQVEVKHEIESEIRKFVSEEFSEYSRYFFTQIDSVVALELLRAIAVLVTGHSLTRPQLEQSLLAIKTARPGTRFPFGGTWLHINKKTFNLSVKTP